MLHIITNEFPFDSGGGGGEAKKMLRTQQSGKNKLSDALKAL